MIILFLLGLAGILLMVVYIGYLKSRVAGYIYSERNMSDALNYVDAAIYMKDRQGCYTYANNALLRLRGLATFSSRKIGSKLGEAPTDAETLSESDRRVLDQGERSTEEVTIAIGEKQSVFLESKYPLVDKKGRIVGLAGILTDVTELIRIRRELEQAARTDELTGLFNRRAFFDFADIFLVNARRHGRPLTILIIDIDHFKRINDLFGHPVGDRVLNEVAERMSSAIREVDRIARIGGEEFAVLLPETPLESALEIAGRIRLALQPIQLQCCAEVKPTVSIGVATLHPQDQSIHSLYQRADAALYAAKAGGRDQIVTG